MTPNNAVEIKLDDRKYFLRWDHNAFCTVQVALRMENTSRFEAAVMSSPVGQRALLYAMIGVYRNGKFQHLSQTLSIEDVGDFFDSNDALLIIQKLGEALPKAEESAAPNPQKAEAGTGESSSAEPAASV